MWTYNQTPNPDELYHFGVKGMRWGVRRYQNKDGTYTPKGKKRRRVESEDSKRFRELSKKKPYEMSNKELTEYNKRAQQISNYKRSRGTKAGKAVALTLAGATTANMLMNAANNTYNNWNNTSRNYSKIKKDFASYMKRNEAKKAAKAMKSFRSRPALGNPMYSYTKNDLRRNRRR